MQPITQQQPLVSILMTSYNRELYIAEAIESVLALHYKNFELIIVDDGSKDKTVAIAQQYAQKDPRIVLHINQHNLGDYPNRNKAASYARGKYIKYLDSDDKIYPFSIDVMVNAMEQNPDAVLGLCHFQVQDDRQSYPIKFDPAQAYYHHFFKGGLLFSGPSGSIIRRDFFLKNNGFSGKRYVSDTELWLKIAQTTPVLMLQPALIWWRRHEGQEFNIGHVNEEYLLLNFDLNKTFLESEKCPLSPGDKLIAIKNYKNRFSRKILKKIIKGKFYDAGRMKKITSTGMNDILSSLIPVNKLKKLFS